MAIYYAHNSPSSIWTHHFIPSIHDTFVCIYEQILNTDDRKYTCLLISLFIFYCLTFFDLTFIQKIFSISLISSFSYTLQNVRLSNFLTTSQNVRIAADQANFIQLQNHDKKMSECLRTYGPQIIRVPSYKLRIEHG